MTRFDKSKLPSRHVSVGPERAPHRSYYYAMGLTEELSLGAHFKRALSIAAAFGSRADHLARYAEAAA